MDGLQVAVREVGGHLTEALLVRRASPSSFAPSEGLPGTHGRSLSAAGPRNRINNHCNSNNDDDDDDNDHNSVQVQIRIPICYTCKTIM